MALAMAPKRAEPDGPGLVAGAHAEMCMLYRESAETIRFAKSQQWKTLGSALLVFGALMLIAYGSGGDGTIVKALLGASLALSCGTLYALVIYQVWQSTERRKLHRIAEHMTETTREIRALSSPVEADLFRYVLLTFMAATVVIGNAIVILELRPHL